MLDAALETLNRETVGKFAAVMIVAIAEDGTNCASIAAANDDLIGELAAAADEFLQSMRQGIAEGDNNVKN